MNLIFEEGIWSLSNPEIWVGIGLLIFVGILILAGVPKLIAGALDAKAAKIQADLDEAARLRAEAEALLASIRQEKAEADAQAAETLKAAEADARRLEVESRAKLEETLARRQALAERRIAQAEVQAAAEVKAAAAEMAVDAAERILASQLASQKTDPLADAAIAQIGSRLS
ncbi:ATP F0F1 synthase subunit B [Brevundimonas sp. Leaf363]|uniref:F0F1 ATP synthase subunit B n=1 Tax=Brevundimonas sp. Leaf363 TaxID=1736353 RepID=UPI0006FEDAE9|nr:F0F1 ATP synthase subunit B [Brevundimonas sp. Leaf363]KQS54369.1 ATP F0F1 synthase subunit B [Brevundimonas sp. Leaf363]